MPPLVTLPALLSLYRLDRDLHTLRVGLDTVQKDQRVQQSKIAGLTKTLETQATAQKKLQAEIAEQDLELKSRQEHIEKMRTSLNTTKTNKEYSAILVQISAEKADVAKVETALMDKMQTAETNGKAVDALRQQIDAENETLKKIESEHGDKVSALQVQVDALMEKRDALKKSVPADALRQYERVSQKYPGDALAAVEFDENDLDSVTCGSCYMGLNAEHVNALRGRDDIRRCNTCGRILYLAEMVKAGQPVS